MTLSAPMPIRQTTTRRMSPCPACFDPASLAILERLNHVVSLLETKRPGSSEHDLSPDILTHISHIAGDHSPPEDLDVEDDLLEDTPNFPASIHNCESVLKWPVFHGLVPDVESFIKWPETNETASPFLSRRRTLGRGVQEEDFIPLSKKFLSYAHTRNPILNVGEFSSYVRGAAETGLRWDGPSCLVLISCALGCISMPYESTEGTQEPPSTPIPTLDSMNTSAAYYLAAKKRLGLLEPSLLYVQCLFLCGVLEMYYMDPLRAWHFFNQACVQFRNLLWRRGNTQSSEESHVSSETRRLEQRLYWSCMKSECELRCEINLPTSGISRFGFPNVFPSPPNELSSPVVSSHPHNGSSVATSVALEEEERSWFYYLAEISCRRMMNRAFTALGRNGESSWIHDFQETLKHFNALKEQMAIWYSHIPSQLDLAHREGVNNELAHYVRARAFTYQEWIHRPFLYYVVHQPKDDPYIAQAMPLAEKCLDLTVQCQAMVHPFHRHHGTWFIARNSMARASILLAAAMSKKVKMPEGWRGVVESALLVVQYWQDEAPDLRKAGEIVRDLLESC
ncbi:hypothetical protein QQX98_000711 [Neonectria punicea]|uniref:Xylanolytic transcriptional activator regulatory domain-containing protein n=1 Tax=Neonectria punicea TaxID=979145 RepID=A0ABR1HST8_9HYPO